MPALAERVGGAGASVALDAASFAAAVNGTIVREGRNSIRGAAVDSRRVEPGNAFFALPGERTDGHMFLVDAAHRGAAALVVTQDPDREVLASLAGLPGGGPQVISVDDALVALQQAAAEWRNRFEPIVVGVTGSLAKTSTKEQIAEVLSERWNVLRNTANENNEIGLPLTLLRLAPEHEIAVLEMGMYAAGDISPLAALARPTIGVVTAVRGTHLSRAGSIDEIERGKRELVEALPSGGTAILNADDPRVARMAHAVASGVEVMTYGFEPSADVTAAEVVSLGPDGMRFLLRASGGDAAVVTSALGRHSVHNALAAAAVGIALGLDLGTISRGLARPFAMPHRTTLIDLGPIKVLDDSYNASPDSMIAALDLLVSLPGRHVAIMGEMLELGESSAAEHRSVGKHAGDVVDLLISGVDEYLDGARKGRAETRHEGKAELLEHGANDLRPGDIVLIKGSRGAGMEELLPVLEAAAKRMMEPVG